MLPTLNSLKQGISSFDFLAMEFTKQILLFKKSGVNIILLILNGLSKIVFL